jgi:hypothetical protein
MSEDQPPQKVNRASGRVRRSASRRGKTGGCRLPAGTQGAHNHADSCPFDSLGGSLRLPIDDPGRPVTRRTGRLGHWRASLFPAIFSTSVDSVYPFRVMVVTVHGLYSRPPDSWRTPKSANHSVVTFSALLTENGAERVELARPKDSLSSGSCS